MAIVNVYHGSANFDPKPGYKGGKPSNYHFGIGLYTTTSYRWANNYGRRQYVLTLDLDPNKAACKVEIPIQYCQGWANIFLSQKLAKLFKKEFQYRDTLSASRFEIWLYWNVKNLNKIAVQLAQFFSFWNCQYNIENGEYGSKLVRIFDFDCIKESNYNTKQYNDFIIPDEIPLYA